MTYDPNWFYSSLAQSAAGLVALLGAVLAARLQEQYTRAVETRVAVVNLLERLRKNLEGKVTEAHRYVEFSEERINDLKAAIHNQQTSLSISHEMDLWGVSRSGEISSIDLPPKNRFPRVM